MFENEKPASQGIGFSTYFADEEYEWDRRVERLKKHETTWKDYKQQSENHDQRLQWNKKIKFCHKSKGSVKKFVTILPSEIIRDPIEDDIEDKAEQLFDKHSQKQLPTMPVRLSQQIAAAAPTLQRRSVGTTPAKPRKKKSFEKAKLKDNNAPQSTKKKCVMKEENQKPATRIIVPSTQLSQATSDAQSNSDLIDLTQDQDEKEGRSDAEHNARRPRVFAQPVHFPSSLQSLSPLGFTNQNKRKSNSKASRSSPREISRSIDSVPLSVMDTPLQAANKSNKNTDTNINTISKSTKRKQAEDIGEQEPNKRIRIPDTQGEERTEKDKSSSPRYKRRDLPKSKLKSKTREKSSSNQENDLGAANSNNDSDSGLGELSMESGEAPRYTFGFPENLSQDDNSESGVAPLSKLNGAGCRVENKETEERERKEKTKDHPDSSIFASTSKNTKGTIASNKPASTVSHANIFDSSSESSSFGSDLG